MEGTSSRPADSSQLYRFDHQRTVLCAPGSAILGCGFLGRLRRVETAHYHCFHRARLGCQFRMVGRHDAGQVSGHAHGSMLTLGGRSERRCT